MDYELLRLRLYAAFVATDDTYAALGERVSSRLGERLDGSTVWRLLNEDGALAKTRGTTLFALAHVLGVPIHEGARDAVTEAVEVYGRGAVDRILQGVGHCGGAKEVLALLERVAAMTPAERGAMFKLLGVQAGEEEGEAKHDDS